MTKKLTKQSDLEHFFLTRWLQLFPDMEEPEREYAFLRSEGKRYKADFAWPARKIIVEIDGGGWVQGRHHRSQGYTNDRLRDLDCLAFGWLVIRLTGEMLDNLDVYEKIRLIFDKRPPQYTAVP